MECEIRLLTLEIMNRAFERSETKIWVVQLVEQIIDKVVMSKEG